MAFIQDNEVYIINDGNTPKIEEGDQIKNNASNQTCVVTESRLYVRESFPSHYKLKVINPSNSALENRSIVYKNINNSIQGDYGKINSNSVDSSTNLIESKIEVFRVLKDSIVNSNLEKMDKNNLIKEVEKLEKTVGKPSFYEGYRKFIENTANHITLIAPFIPQLTQFLS